MTINAVTYRPPGIDMNVPGDRVLHPKVSLPEARWNSIAHLLDEAGAWVKPGALEGSTTSEIGDAWHALHTAHDIPPALREFLLRAGRDAPFFHRDFEDSYRPEHYPANRDFANGFLGHVSPSTSVVTPQCVGESGRLVSSVVVVACNVGRGDYYCVDAADSDAPIVRLYADHGELKSESMSMLEFLSLELINYWLKVASREA